MKNRKTKISALIIIAIMIVNSLTACGVSSATTSPDLKDLEQKAAQGDIDAMYDVGYIYLIGDGVEIDYDKAFEYFTKAADKGMAQAYGSVGYCYQNGLGVEADLDKMLEY